MKPIKTNEDRMFKKISRYFSEPRDALREAIQNAYRAGWPNPKQNVITITVEQTSDSTSNVTITDLGRGIPDFGIMLSPMDSEWADDVEADQDPAGLGVYALLAYSESVKFFTVCNGKVRELLVNTKEFMNSKEYRDSLAEREVVKDTECTLTGTTVTLNNFKMDEYDASSKCRSLLYYMHEVPSTVNGEDVETVKKTNLLFENDDIEVWSSGDTNQTHSSYYRYIYVDVVWHGMAIDVKSERLEVTLEGHTFDVDVGNMFSHVFGDLNIKVFPKRERLFTFKLPDRNALVTTEKSTEVLAAVCTDRYTKSLEREIARAMSHEGSALYDAITALGVPYEVKQILRKRVNAYLYTPTTIPRSYSDCPKPLVTTAVGTKYLVMDVYITDRDGDVTAVDQDYINWVADSDDLMRDVTYFDGSDASGDDAVIQVDLYIPESRARNYNDTEVTKDDVWNSTGKNKAYLVDLESGKRIEISYGVAVLQDSSPCSFPSYYEMYIEGNYQWLARAAEHWAEMADEKETQNDNNPEDKAEIWIALAKFKAWIKDTVHLSDLVDSICNRIDTYEHDVVINPKLKTVTFGKVTLGYT